jgi:RNA polymerase sigma-70 factor (ECF subfamily)
MLLENDAVNPCASPSSDAALGWLREHGDALYAYAVLRARDSHVAEDLVQETLLAAMGAAGDFRGESSERSWLFGILKHKLLDHLRQALRERPLVGENGADGLEELFDRRGHWKVRVSKWGADPHTLAESAEFRAVLTRCLSRLPARMAHLFWLRQEEGAETPRLCEELNISAANAWAILHRARAGLRKCLTTHWFNGEVSR